MKGPGRLLTAMVTPFDENGEVDYEQAKKLALALLDSGSEGLVAVGTTGESPTLVREEEARLFSEIKSAVGSRGTVIAGTGSNSTAEAVEATRGAERVGVDACLLVVPYYNKPTQEGLYQHFKTVAQSTSLPCILYNVPSRTVASLSAETVIRLSQKAPMKNDGWRISNSAPRSHRGDVQAFSARLPGWNWDATLMRTVSVKRWMSLMPA